MPKNADMNAARKAKNDEFYTQLADIEREFSFYGEYFRGKTVYCNCDNPKWSNFWSYFRNNFNKLGIKHLISTYYDENEPAFKRSFNGVEEKSERLLGNGDFRSPECVEILKESDVVVTNPPFSLFREFMALMIEKKKDFSILGNMNAATCKGIFQYFRSCDVFFGPSIFSGDRKFYVPKDYPLNAAGCGIDEDGKRFIRVKGVRWFTNIQEVKRPEPIQLVQDYSPEKYPRFDNYDAINVDKTMDIPKDYEGIMGVPITFLDKFCPEQFEVIGLDAFVEDNPRPGHRFTLNGKTTYARILIQKRK